MNLRAILTGMCFTIGLFSFGQHMPPTEFPSEVQESNVQLFAPNAFTPDGDYYNDTWKVHVEGIDVYDFHLSIYDRSGQVVWESYDATGEWDGSYGGHLAPDGIYVWSLETGNAETDEKHQFTGFITVLR